MRRKSVAFATFWFLAALASRGAVVFDQPHNGTGTVILSSWLDPDGSDADIYSYDKFILASDAAITEVKWRGGYQYGGTYGKIWNFTITFYESILNGAEPHVTNPQLHEFYLAQYDVGGTAGETPAGNFGGVDFYDYQFTLPAPFAAQAGVPYWIRIQAAQVGYPDWGVAAGSGGDSSHFQFSTGSAMFSYRSGDEAITFLATDGPTWAIAASASPAAGGTVFGAGPYPVGSTATLTATPASGWAFVNWTENGNPVSSSATYQFTATSNRTLVAHFSGSVTIATSAVPPVGGTTSGDGVFPSGSSVTVHAVPSAGYNFFNWTEFGTSVSASADYTFVADRDYTLEANFAPAKPTLTFDFDTGFPTLTAGQGTPLSQTVAGLTAHFGSTQGGDPLQPGHSTQSESTTFWHLSAFSGLYLTPNSVFRTDLNIFFSHPVEKIIFDFATVENHQTEYPTPIKLTAHMTTPTDVVVGTGMAQATYASDTFPMGVMTYDSGGQPFNWVRIEVPYQPSGATTFLIDNIIVTPSVVPTNDATWISQTLPGQMKTGESLWVGLTVENSGYTTWTLENSYALAVVSDPCGLFASNRIPLEAGAPIGPGQIHQFITQATAPVTTGTCAVQLQMTQDGGAGLFGAPLDASVTIVTPPNAVAEWSGYD